jgi:hypothetical protein
MIAPLFRRRRESGRPSSPASVNRIAIFPASSECRKNKSVVPGAVAADKGFYVNMWFPWLTPGEFFGHAENLKAGLCGAGQILDSIQLLSAAGNYQEFGLGDGRRTEGIRAAAWLMKRINSR